MIANILNTLIGLTLVYLAVLKPDFVDGRPLTLLIAGVVVAGLALWARAGDSMRWFSLTNMAMGAALLALSALQVLTTVAPSLTFWGVFWSGMVTAVLALWAALYRPVPAQIPA
jgi:hypothetical protein